MNNDYSELYEKLSHLQWLLHRQHLQSHSERGPMADPSRGQGRVLAMLKLQPEISSNDLAYVLGIRQQSLNELLNKLEKSGYITRVPSPADGRVMLVQLTEKGREQQQNNTEQADIFSCLNEDEQKTFGQYLDLIIESAENQFGAKDDDDMYAWMQSARERMGKDKFDHLMSMHGSRFQHKMAHLHGMWAQMGKDGRFGDGFAGPDFACGENMHGGFPQAERFAADYDGPRPDRYEGFACKKRNKKQDSDQDSPEQE